MEPQMRAKLEVTEVVRHKYGDQLKMTPVCKPSYGEDGLDENNTYAKFTPSGELTLLVANPALLGQFAPGDVYYVDFTKV